MVEATGTKVLLEIINNLDRFAEDVKKRSGILMSERVVQGQPNTGKVHSIGSAVEDAEFQVGDTVIFNKQDMFMGLKLDDKDLVAVEASEIVAKIQEAK